jgi:hypothetical protein
MSNFPFPDLSGFLVVLMISFPLAIWKLIDIIIWLCHHIHITIG